MNDIELLAAMIAELGSDLRSVIEAMTPEELAWQPASQANSIGVTL